MSEGQVGSGSEAEEPGGEAAGTESAGVDPAAVLVAVERVQSDIAALGRAVAASPEEVAARLDVDAAVAAVGVRVSTLGSALDQLRHSLLAALDRTADRLDAPPWLTNLHSVLVGLGRRFDSPVWMPELQGALAELASTGGHDDQLRQAASEISLAVERLPRLEELAATVASLGIDTRLDSVAATVDQLADGIRAGGAVADALERLGERLGAIETEAAGAAREAHALSARVASVPDRLSAIASQVDRITPLARVGDQAGTLFDRLDRVTAGVEEVVALLNAGGSAARGDEEEDDDARFEAVVDVLSGVSRRQDEVTAAVGSMLDQVRSPKGLESVLERAEQRERSLAARLDRIDDELRRLIERGRLDVAPPAADGAAAQAIAALLSTVEQQERELASRLDKIDLELRRVGEAADVSDWAPEVKAGLADLSRRLDAPGWVGDLERRLDAPPWLTDLQAALADLGSDRVRHDELRQAVAEIGVAVERSPRLEELTAAVGDLRRDSRIDDVATAVAQLAGGVRAGAAVADALEGLEERLAAIEAAGYRAAQETRALSAQVAPVPDRLGAIASQVDRLLPLARAGDEAGTLFDQLERLTSGMDQAIRLLSARTALAMDERLDQLSATVARVADDDRLDQLAGTVAALDPGDRLARMEQRLDELVEDLRAGAGSSGPGEASGEGEGEEDEDERFEALVDVLSGVTRRQDEVTAAVASMLDQVRAQTSEASLFGRGQQENDETTRLLDTVLDRVQQQEQTIAEHLDWVGDRLAAFAAQVGANQAGAPATGWLDDERAETTAVLDRMSRRQDELAAAISDLVEQGRGPTATNAVFDRMEQRERSLAARLDRIDLELRRRPESGSGGEDGSEIATLAASVDEVAVVTSNLAGLVEDLAERLDHRLSGVEASLGDAQRSPAVPRRPSPSSEVAALRLAELRAERAQVQARLQAERLLAAETRDDG